MFKVASVSLGLLIFTRSQIQVSIDVGTLLDTATDCLRFVTEFFEVINQSAPHIYHSALMIAPKSSAVWKLHGQHLHSPILRAVTGFPTSWGSCTASVGVTTEVYLAGWSPSGQFIAVGLVGRMEIRDPMTLEIVSVLKPPHYFMRYTPKSLAFSPNGQLLACFYYG